MLLDLGGQSNLLRSLDSTDAVTLVYACGCLQNLCDNPEWALTLVSQVYSL